MSLDVYSPCPGGFDRKIKFCCTDMVHALDQILTQLDGDQVQGALRSIDRQLARTPDRACLLALKVDALQAADRGEEVAPVVERLCSQHPDNPISLACQAAQLCEEPVPEFSLDADDSPSLEKYQAWAEELRQMALRIIDLTQSALEACSRSIPLLVYQAIGTVGGQLLRLRQSAAAFQHILIQARLTDDPASPAMEMVNSMLSSPLVPVCFKTEFRFPPAPEDLAWKTEYNAAARLGNRCLWRKARAEMNRLLEQHGESERLVRAMGHLEVSLGCTPEAVAAFRRLADLTDDSLAAVEAEHTALELEATAGLHASGVYEQTVEVSDGPAVLEQMQSHPRLRAAAVDPATVHHDDSPPPKALLQLLDREYTAATVYDDWADVPRLWATVRYFGKETDRPARITWYSSNESTAQRVAEALQGVLGTHWQEPSSRMMEVMYHPFVMPTIHPLPEAVGPALHQTPRTRHDIDREALSNWLDQATPLLSGQPPRAAAEDPSLRRRLQAVLLGLETHASHALHPEDFEDVRRDLGLSNFPLEMTWDEAVPEIPAGRLGRLKVADMATDRLVQFFGMAIRYRLYWALLRISQELLQRTEEPQGVPADRIHHMLARTASDGPTALAHLQAAEAAVVKRGESAAGYLLEELSLRLHTGIVEDARLKTILQTLSSRYAKEPGVLDQLKLILNQFGLIRPDGRVGVPAASQVEAATSQIVTDVPAAAPVEPNAPEGQAAPATPSKLWLPGQD